ncbi:MAG: cytochrome c oxidase subunit II [Microbacterium sp.]
MPSKRRTRLAAISVIAVSSIAALTGCTPTQLHGYLPGWDASGQPTTNQTERISTLWVGSWVAALVVGLITWGLMLWAITVYRRRRGQTGLPVQLRYNMPIEMFFTIVPLILVFGLFSFTARDQTELTAIDENPDVQITAIGKQWSWDFQYGEGDDAVWTMGTQAQPGADGSIDESALPQLVLPVNKTVTVDIESRDVIHSFWIIDFLYKEDMVPGHPNQWSFTPTREGTYKGKCAELCGEYHSMMLFTVKVVSEDEYEDYLDELAAKGNTGDINDEYDRLSNNPGTDGSNVESEENTEEGQ